MVSPDRCRLDGQGRACFRERHVLRPPRRDPCRTRSGHAGSGKAGSALRPHSDAMGATAPGRVPGRTPAARGAAGAPAGRSAHASAASGSPADPAEPGLWRQYSLRIADPSCPAVRGGRSAADARPDAARPGAGSPHGTAATGTRGPGRVADGGCHVSAPRRASAGPPASGAGAGHGRRRPPRGREPVAFPGQHAAGQHSASQRSTGQPDAGLCRDRHRGRDRCGRCRRVRTATRGCDEDRNPRIRSAGGDPAGRSGCRCRFGR